MEALQDILKASHKRSFDKYSENETEDEFSDYIEAPDIIRESFSKTWESQGQTHVVHSRLVTRCLGHFRFWMTFHSTPIMQYNLYR